MAKSAISEAFERQLVDAKSALITKWKPALESVNAPKLTSGYDKYVMAVLLENTERELQNEAVNTTAVLGTQYVPAMLGLVRQTLPRLIGRELCTLQAMSLPTGKMFFLDLLRDDGSNVADHNLWDNNANYAKFDDAVGRPTNPLGEGLDIATGMKLTISSRDISITKSKKLLAEVSWELATDLRAYHNLDAGEILSGAAADEIAREWDAMIVAKAYAAAAANKTVYFGAAPAGYPIEKWPQRVQRAILQADNAVYVEKGRSTNYMIAGVNAALELMDLNTFVPDAGFVGANETAAFGLQRIGTLSQTHRIFRSRYVAPNEIVLGRNGDSVLDSGLFLLAYVPLFITDRVLNPRNQKYEQSFASRMDLVLGGRNDADGQKLFTRVVFDDTKTGITEA